MEWRDEGLLLSLRRLGEGDAILDVLTAAHGRHAGLVKGGGARRMAAALQPGATLSLEWRARLDPQLGAFRAEPVRSRTAALMGDGDALAAFGAAAALLLAFLPEREPAPGLYAATAALFDRLGAAPDWPEAYVGWELALLSELGWPLDLGRCAASGAVEGLAFVSPKTGRAVSAAGAGPWAERLLALPGFLGGPPAADRAADLAAGLALTGRFIEAWIAPAFGAAAPPEARARLVARLSARRAAPAAAR